jgi:LAO/AO transport system ATPase
MPEIDALLERFRRGDRAALARLLTLAGNGVAIGDATRGLTAGGSHKQFRSVAFTGSGGVGKSTLIGKLIELVRRLGLKVAVLACDPQSPLTGGALLGDRIRMATSVDDGIFIRSLAALPGRGAIAEHLTAMVRLLESFGFDIVLVETVGAGQGDTAVREIADVVVLLLQPQTGDDLQWEKAGILEIADVIVVHKADLAGAEQTAAQIRDAVDVPVVMVSAQKGTGVEELWETIGRIKAEG